MSVHTARMRMCDQPSTAVLVRRLYSTTHITAQWPFDPHEVVSLREYAAHMQHWGFHYEVSNEASTLVQMRAVPRIVGVQLDQRHMRKMLEQLVANGAEQPAAAISKPQAFQVRPSHGEAVGQLTQLLFVRY
jgi:hypothetical protein|eukprot:SAG25_NODE_166_length_13075_cov_19.523736_9_plen_132_part_00